MSIIKRIIGLITIIAVVVIAAYFFIWVVLFLAILIPIGLLWLRWKMRKTKSPNARLIRIDTIRKP